MPTGSNQDIPEVIPFFHSEVLPLLCLPLSLCPNASEMADSLDTEAQIGFALLICWSSFIFTKTRGRCKKRRRRRGGREGGRSHNTWFHIICKFTEMTNLSDLETMGKISENRLKD